MPYKSDKQRRYMHAQHPEIAAKWDEEIRSAKRKRVSKASPDSKDLYAAGLGAAGAGAGALAGREVAHRVNRRRLNVAVKQARVDLDNLLRARTPVPHRPLRYLRTGRVAAGGAAVGTGLGVGAAYGSNVPRKKVSKALTTSYGQLVRVDD